MSKLPFELLLALRYLRPKRTFVSIITLISIVGVALGVAVLIIVISVMSGFDHDLRDKILGYKSHLTITQWDPVNQTTTPMKDFPAVAAVIAKNPSVRGVAPFVMGPVLVETQGDTNRAGLQDTPVLRGVDPVAEGNVSDLPRKVIFGNFDLSGHGMVVGSDFARNLNLRLGDHLAVYSAHEIKKMLNAYNNNEHVVSSPSDFEVRGIFSMGYYEFDAHVVITSLANAQDMYDLDDAVHGALVMLKDPYSAPGVKDELQKALGDDVYIETWMEQSSDLLDAIKVEKGLMFYIMFFIVIVASFGITCTLITFVILKTREIGIMKAVGASNFQVMCIFLIQSVIVSVLGVASGLVLGLFALHIRNNFLHFMNHLTGFSLLPPSIYGFGELPAQINPMDIAIICGGSMVICLSASILPARHASKLKPVEALRYE
jgi:lipoprotein-releasing system permease protein